jgi:hypothetical protein
MGTAMSVMKKVYSFTFIVFKFPQHSSVGIVNTIARISRNAHADHSSFSLQHKPYTNDDTAHSTGQAQPKDEKDISSFVVQAICGGHHTPIWSTQCQSSTQDRKSRGMGHHHHVATKGSYNDNVIEEFQYAGEVV